MLDESRGRHSLSRIAYHIVWIPKYRRRILVGKVRKVLEEVLREKVEAMGWRIIAVEIMPDHIHIFLQADNKTSPSEVVRHLKGYSSRKLGLAFPWLRARGHIWAKGCWISTIGNMSAEAVKRYIDAQRSHRIQH